MWRRTSPHRQRRGSSVFTTGSATAGGGAVLAFQGFTPFCTTELGALAGLQDEFAARDVKVIGPSVNPAEDHARWLTDIGDVTGHVPAYPMIADTDLAVAKLYDMRHAAEGEAPGCGPPPITPRCGPLVLSR